MGHFAGFFINEGTQLTGSESPGKFFGFFGQGSQNTGMAVPLVKGRIRGQHIQILMCFHISD